MYKQKTGATEFKTFKEWKETGFSVKKDENSFRVWSAPRKGKDSCEVENIATGETKTHESEYEFWGTCCLFSNLQVEPLTVEKSA